MLIPLFSTENPPQREGRGAIVAVLNEAFLPLLDQWTADNPPNLWWTILQFSSAWLQADCQKSIPEPLVWKACLGGLSHNFNSLVARGGSNCHSWDRTLITGLQTQTLFLLFTAPGIFHSLIPKGLEAIRRTVTFSAMCTACWLKQFLGRHGLGAM